ncbi:MAG: hypothetical protein ACFCU3_02035 [Verrucomicrobiales bacterium]
MLTVQLHRIISASAILVWAGVFAYFFLADRLPAFLAVGFRPLVPVTAVILLLLAIGLLLLPNAEMCRDPDCGHRLERFSLGQILSLIFFIGPILVAAVSAPDGYSATTVTNRLTDASPSMFLSRLGGGGQSAWDDHLPLPTPEGWADETGVSTEDLQQGMLDAQQPDPNVFFDPQGYLEKDEQGNLVVEITDLYIAAGDRRLRQNLEASTLRITGQFLQQTTAGRGPATTPQPKLVRLLVSCCAADAMPIPVDLLGEGVTQNLDDMDWVEAYGKLTFVEQGGERVPALQVERIEKVQAPRELFLYF